MANPLLIALLLVNLLVFLVPEFIDAIDEKSSATSELRVRYEDNAVYSPDAFASIATDADHLRSYMHTAYREGLMVMLGQSETAPAFNLGAQLNALYPDDPAISVLAKGGFSPIHACVTLSRLRAQTAELPPLILVMNLVYFTQSHDVINNSWLSNLVHSPNFLYFNHDNELRQMPEPVQAAYADHFRRHSLLSPLWYQEYGANRLYLWAADRAAEQAEVLVPFYHFDEALPDYDQTRNVWNGYRASDRLRKAQWNANDIEGDSPNRRGVECLLSIARELESPTLIIVLPMNRAYYAHNGISMQDFDSQLGKVRKLIADGDDAGKIFTIDFYDRPALINGFKDRMHVDAYGYRQLAEALEDDPVYAGFRRRVDAYYGAAD